MHTPFVAVLMSWEKIILSKIHTPTYKGSFTIIKILYYVIMISNNIYRGYERDHLKCKCPIIFHYVHIHFFLPKSAS